jgi:Ca2+/H+ antiporter, TMEM165/GDT1 family
VDLVVVALTFSAIFVVELPDKTFIATLVLSTKFRPLLVWIGVGLAFAVQTGIAVGLGKAASLLPTDLVRGGAALLFLGGALILFREARGDRGRGDTGRGDTGRGATAEGADAEAEYAERAGKLGSTTGAGAWRAVTASFLVLFAAEWGDLSQLLTLSLVARYDDPVSVFIGALAALLTVSGLAVLVGRALLNRVSLRLLHTLGGSVCLLLAAITVWELLA